ncbi:MAG TPA: bifunctional hydroxymethylpyrimidine kinase/phosphomethylpyrimidine kinase [Pyrinomonadaceae bacterium]|nr:bifunctional hydroxymethylpyrimidine kinase/phosphomethylpyrimidine kinase [Pyrinomonadaceae bacterium]
MEPDSKSLSALSRALTIAGFDPSGGAGVLADVSTFAAFGLTASAAITSITFQNASQGFGAIDQTGDSVRAQVLPLLDDFTFGCAKTGMLPTSEVVREVARLFRESGLPRPVVDPVMVSSSGQRLMEENALERFIFELLPLARLVTPNIPEAEALTGASITSESEMRRAAATIRKMGTRAVLIKGGHLPTLPEESIDVLDNDGDVTVFREMRIAGPGIRGSGCVLSAAIAAGLGNGETLEEAVAGAKSFVLETIRWVSERG